MDFVVLDIETTDFSPAKGGRIIEIGAVKVVNGVIVDEFSELVNPGINIPKKITSITNITNEMVALSPSINLVLQRFWNFIDGFVVVAHNAKFDWDTFLKPGFEGISKYVEGNAVCTLKISKKIYGTKCIDENGEKITISNKLEDVCKRNNVVLENAHRAISDCKALAECVLEMSAKYEIMRQAILNGDKVRLDKNRNLEIDYKVHSVKYWQPVKPKKKNEKPPRIFYVDLTPKDIEGLTDMCYPGTVMFDINSKSWCNKDFLYNLDYNELEKRVLKASGVSSLEELYYMKLAERKKYMLKTT